MDNFLPFNKHYTVVTTPLFPPSIFFLCSISVLISTFTYEQQQYSKGRTRQNGKRIIFCTALPPSQLLPNHFNLTVTNLHFFFWWKIYINIKRSEMLRRVCCIEAEDCVLSVLYKVHVWCKNILGLLVVVLGLVFEDFQLIFVGTASTRHHRTQCRVDQSHCLPCTSVQKLSVKV